MRCCWTRTISRRTSSIPSPTTRATRTASLGHDTTLRWKIIDKPCMTQIYLHFDHYGLSSNAPVLPCRYCRATRAVSMAPAAYYAHLLAARARAFLDDSDFSSDSDSRGYSDTVGDIGPNPFDFSDAPARVDRESEIIHARIGFLRDRRQRRALRRRRG